MKSAPLLAALVLTATARLLTAQETPTAKFPQVEVEFRFIELTKEALSELELADPITPTKNPPVAPSAILDAKKSEEFIRALNAKKGVDLISAPRVITKSKQRATIEIIREFRYPTEFERKDGKTVPTTFETRNCGITAEVEPTVGEGEEITLQMVPQIVEFLGFISYPSGKAMPAKRAPGEKLIDRLVKPGVPDEPFTQDEIRQPIFSTRKITTEITFISGQTVVFRGLDEAASVPGFDTPSNGRHLLLLVRASIVKPS